MGVLYLFYKAEWSWANNLCQWVLPGIVCAFMITLCVHFHTVGQVDAMRYSHIQTQMEKHETTIYIPEIPSKYVWDRFSEWGFEELYFYEQKGDIDFVLVDYDSWTTQYMKH